jgi:chromosome segregation ATPase
MAGIPPKDTVATTVQNSQPDLIPDMPPIAGLDVITIGGVGVLGAWQVGRIIVRRFFKDSAEITKDRAETNIVILLQEDNAALHKKNDSLMERVEEVSKERNEAVSQLGRFLAESELYKEKIKELQASVLVMTNKLDELSTTLNTVLLENGRLKYQVELLDESNSKLLKEMDDLGETLKGLNHPASKRNAKTS